MPQFVLLVHDVVCERESGARRAMATMGLLPLPFWASWVLFQVRCWGEQEAGSGCGVQVLANKPH